MGIFRRMKTIAAADINSLLDCVEDPIAMLNEYSREMEQEIVKGQKALARQLLVKKKQEALISEMKGLVDKRRSQAKLAIDRGEEAIAKLAVSEKLTNVKQLSLYQEQLQSIKEQTQILIGKLEELKAAYQQMQHKKILLASRANVAQSMKQIQKATVSFQTESISRGIARAEEKIMLMEAEVQAGNQFPASLVQYETANQSFISDEELNSEIEKLKSQKEGI